MLQPGGAEEDSRLCEGNRHLHLAYDEEEEEGLVLVDWLHNIPATCTECLRTDILRQCNVLPHCDKSYRSNLLSYQSGYTDTSPTSPSTDTVVPGAWQGSH